ncbi:MAG: caspase family protein [Nitrospirae bacterium]|nr:caspase family protein [Nitrospirota bacterium]
MKKVIFLSIILFLFFLFISPEFSSGGEPPNEPILRIETEVHTAVINRIGIDAENRYIVTGSDDKTIRVWDLSDGRLIRIIRPPIGDGDEGKIYAIALSPDGNTIAGAGWTKASEGFHNIYLFDLKTGSLIKRLTGFPNVIDQLSYSKDGRFLVVGLGRDNGIRIYKTSDYSLVAEDKDYGFDIYGTDFDKYGRLVTSSYDGYIRLYDSSFKLIAKKKARSGSRPFQVSFSPQGKIAVGLEDVVAVDILSGKDLEYLYSPDTTGIDGSLGRASWSSDGRSLYAGGKFQKKFDGIWQFAIRRWSAEGRGQYIDFPVSANTLMHIIPLKDGGIAFGAYDPAFGVINEMNERVLFISPSIADYRGLLENLLVSYEGETIQFGYETWGASPARFSVVNRILESEPLSPEPGLKPPLITGIDITDWEDTYEPKLNRVVLKLDEYEKCRSLAISPDKNSFLLGAEWSLRAYDKNGNEKWNISTPSVAWAVNISGNGKVAVAAFGDGTIRWFRMSDGKELLTLFPHKDKRKWVASAGSEELIGWHINNGKDQSADFFPASRFRSTYYRADIIEKVLKTVDEDEAILLADKESGRGKQETSIQKILPPIVAIVSPSDSSEVSSTQITVRFTIRTPSGEPITGIKALVDGRPVSAQRGVSIKPKGDDIREIEVTIPERDSVVSIIAENIYSASEPATITLKWRGKKEEKFVIKPKLYALAIGVSKYEDKDLALNFPAKDAVDFANAVTKQKGELYREVVVKVLTDEKATKDNILDGLEWLEQEVTSKDVAMLFIAGHGVNDPTGNYYFLPVDADSDKLKRTGVVFSEIKTTIASLAGKTIMFVDTCYSGNVMGTRKTDSNNNKATDHNRLSCGSKEVKGCFLYIGQEG